MDTTASGTSGPADISPDIRGAFFIRQSSLEDLSCIPLVVAVPGRDFRFWFNVLAGVSLQTLARVQLARRFSSGIEHDSC